MVSSSHRLACTALEWEERMKKARVTEQSESSRAAAMAARDLWASSDVVMRTGWKKGGMRKRGRRMMVHKSRAEIKLFRYWRRY